MDLGAMGVDACRHTKCSRPGASQQLVEELGRDFEVHPKSVKFILMFLVVVGQVYQAASTLYDCMYI